MMTTIMMMMITYRKVFFNPDNRLSGLVHRRWKSAQLNSRAMTAAAAAAAAALLISGNLQVSYDASTS